MGFAFDDLSGKVISAAMEVHKQLGPGFLESVYEQAMRIELSKRHVPFEAQKQIKISYGGQIIGTHVLDILVDNQLVVELKATNGLEEVHYAQLRSYLRATDTKVGLLMNFNSPRLTVKRVVHNFQQETEACSI